MPLWKVSHPVGAYTAQDKQEFAENVTHIYEAVPLPKFYVVFMFDEIAEEDLIVGGEPRNNFVRIVVDQMARTMPGSDIAAWWVTALDTAIAPWVGDRGYDWELNILEPRSDLWSLNGFHAPPFESHAEKRWIKENKASAYSLDEKLPVNLSLLPGDIAKPAGHEV